MPAAQLEPLTNEQITETLMCAGVTYRTNSRVFVLAPSEPKFMTPDDIADLGEALIARGVQMGARR